MARPRGKRLTPEEKADVKSRFCDVYRTMRSVRKTCAALAINRTTIYQWRQNDEQFAAAYAEAEADICDDIESEIMRRGLTGWTDTQTTTERDALTGEMVVTKIIKTKKYDSTLLRLLAAAHMPDRYGQRLDVTSRGEQLGSAYVALSAIIGDTDRANEAATLIESIAGYRINPGGAGMDSEQRALASGPPFGATE